MPFCDISSVLYIEIHDIKVESTTILLFRMYQKDHIFITISAIYTHMDSNINK